jgi:hypothetical protein
LSAKYKAASERIITDVKLGNAAIWNKSFGFSCVFFKKDLLPENY